MKDHVVLAYSGSLASSAAVRWLQDRHGAEVVTVTLDVGQAGDLDEVRGRALACGAVRAHVIDARDTFAREYVTSLIGGAATIDAVPIDELAHPLIARTLVEIAAIEAADAVAHASRAASSGAGGTLDAQIARADPALRVMAPAREWHMDESALAEYARARHLPVSVGRREKHMLIRQSVAPSRAAQPDAQIEVAFERGIPVAINGVPMALEELIESLSLIGGQHGLGYADAVPAPAALILGAAYRAAHGADGPVRLTIMGSEVILRGHSVDADLTSRSVLLK